MDRTSLSPMQRQESGASMSEVTPLARSASSAAVALLCSDDEDVLEAAADVADAEALTRNFRSNSTPQKESAGNGGVGSDGDVDGDAGQGPLHTSTEPFESDQSRLLFDQFESRSDAIRSLLFDDDAMQPTPEKDDSSGESLKTLEPLVNLPPLFEVSHAALPPPLLPLPPLPLSTDTEVSLGSSSPAPALDVLPAIDSIVHDPTLLARSHGSLTGAYNDQLAPPLTSSSTLPTALAFPMTSLSRGSSFRESRRGSTETDGSILFRYASPPLPSSAPIRRSVSTVDGRPAQITPFKQRSGEGDASGARGGVFSSGRFFAPSPLLVPGMLRQHSSLSLQQAVRDGIIAPFRTSRRASAASLSSTASPRPSHAHPLNDFAASTDDAAPAYPPHLQRLKQHLDAYIAESLASMKLQLEEAARTYLHQQLQASQSPAMRPFFSHEATRSASMEGAPPSNLEHTAAVAALSPRPLRMHHMVGTVGASLPPFSPLTLHSPQSIKRLPQHTTPLVAHTPPFMRQSPPPIVQG